MRQGAERGSIMANRPNNPRYEDVLIKIDDMPYVLPSDTKGIKGDTLRCRIWEGGVTDSVYIGFFNEFDELVFRAMTSPEQGRRLVEGIRYAEELEKLAK